ncbi:MAG: acyloxyacyl hydrolase [Nibricoccus sp.]
MKYALALSIAMLVLPLARLRAVVEAPSGEAVFSSGISGLFDTEHNITTSVEYRFARNWAKIHPWAGLSWATDGAVFAGGGILYSLLLPKDGWRLTFGVGPGYYERHQGADLGSHLEFCTFGEISRNMPWKHRVMLRLIHISNGGLTEQNPGNELLMLGYAMPLP